MWWNKGNPWEIQSDLRNVLVAAREARRADGWVAEEIGRRSNSFFSFEESFHNDGHLQSHHKYEAIPQADILLTFVPDTVFCVSTKTVAQDPTSSYA